MKRGFWVLVITCYIVAMAIWLVGCSEVQPQRTDGVCGAQIAKGLTLMGAPQSPPPPQKLPVWAVEWIGKHWCEPKPALTWWREYYQDPNDPAIAAMRAGEWLYHPPAENSWRWSGASYYEPRDPNVHYGILDWGRLVNAWKGGK